eukprot:TRINITY_DN2254_c0_g3_i1.p1 TRINITY_DN2254_c0_g3~~TRINITY_DN2254_c0_g3_i1.p1  ORF type:complete len:444 (-),score=112.44 TRINITY_DN2254_c0_g3_i1:1025-2356(-)
MSLAQDPNYDQENRNPAGHGLGVRRAGKVVASEAVESRPAHRQALGEVQNLRRMNQPLRTQVNKGGFTIFCDDTSSGVRSSSTSSARTSSSSSTAVLEDKENQQPNLTKLNRIGKSTDVLRVQQTKTVIEEPEVLRVQQTRAVQLLHHEPMNTSLDVDSPMVVEEKEQWRVPPIKDNHTVDIFSEPEYFQDIYRYLLSSEAKHLPKWNYMAKQTDITHSMRSILIDWLVEVGEEYKLQTETLHLAVNYIDRFLSYMAVQRSKLQLVGTACMFIAAKYEEIYPPDVGEFVYITDDTYNKRQVLRMEHLVLKVLGFDLSVPTMYIFLNKVVEMGQLESSVKEKVSSLAAYLSELSLVDGENFLKYNPSKVAAACVALARHCLEQEAWSADLQARTGHSLDDLKPVILLLHQMMKNALTSSQQAVREKYKQSKHFGVAELPIPSIF